MVISTKSKECNSIEFEEYSVWSMNVCVLMSSVQMERWKESLIEELVLQGDFGVLERNVLGSSRLNRKANGSV